MRDRAVVVGPGDRIDPWSAGGEWLACTPARLAVVGSVFEDAIAPWPEVARLARRPGRRALALTRDPGDPAERVLELLWRLVARWGQPEAGGLALPHDLRTPGIAALAGLSEPMAGGALEALQASGALTRRRDGTWRLAPPRPDSPARERLRAKAAEQRALARLTQAETAILFTELETLRLAGLRLDAALRSLVRLAGPSRR